MPKWGKSLVGRRDLILLLSQFFLLSLPHLTLLRQRWQHVATVLVCHGSMDVLGAICVNQPTCKGSWWLYPTENLFTPSLTCLSKKKLNHFLHPSFFPQLLPTPSPPYYIISSRRFLKISSCECNFCASCAWTFSSSNSSRSRSSSKSFCRSSPWRPGSCWMESPVEVWGKNWLDGFWMVKPKYMKLLVVFLGFCHGQIWMKQSFSPCFKSLRPSQSPVAGDLFVQLPKHNGADGGSLRELGPSENPGRDVLKPIRNSQIESISCRCPASKDNLYSLISSLAALANDSQLRI